jgi:hypothetical protein
VNPKIGDLVRLKAFTEDTSLMNSNLSGGTGLVLAEHRNDGRNDGTVLWLDLLITRAEAYGGTSEIALFVPIRDILKVISETG